MQEAPDGTIRVVVAPITHTPPADPDASIEIPAQVKARLGLDGERSWVRIDEVNRFVWPGYDLRSTGPAGRMGLWDAPRRPLCSGDPRHPGVAGGPQGQGEEPGLGPMLFTQGVRAGIGTFAEAEFSMPWGRRPGLGEQDSGLSEQHWA
jgi:hypothetical protein